MEARTLTTIDRFGRVVIPKQIRQELGLVPGSQVEIVERDHEVVVSPVMRRPSVVDKGGILIVQSEVVEDIEKAVERDRSKRMADLIRSF